MNVELLIGWTISAIVIVGVFYYYYPKKTKKVFKLLWKFIKKLHELRKKVFVVKPFPKGDK